MNKIAVPTEDHISIVEHFGKSTHFLVFDTTDGKIVKHEVRMNTHALSSEGGCGTPGHHAHGHGHTHADIVELLQDCGVVICHGMGHCAAEALAAHGITPIIVGEAITAQAAVEAYLSGNLIASTRSFCQCHH